MKLPQPGSGALVRQGSESMQGEEHKHSGKRTKTLVDRG